MTTPKASRTPEEESTNLKPVPWLIILGFVVVAFPFFFLLGQPMATAIMVAFGFTCGMYGLWPSYKMASGDFKSLRTPNPLKVFGPAALGLFLFLTIWLGFRPTPRDKLVTLIARQGAGFNQYMLPSGETLVLVDVESWSTDDLVKDLNDMQDVLRTQQAYNPKQMTEFSQEVLTQLGLPSSHIPKAMQYVGDYLKAQDGDAQQGWERKINADWEALIDDVSTRVQGGGKLFKQKVDRLPFAFVTVNGNLRLIFPGQFSVGSTAYKVPVIANPKRNAVTNLDEAIVIEMP